MAFLYCPDFQIIYFHKLYYLSLSYFIDCSFYSFLYLICLGVSYCPEYKFISLLFSFYLIFFIQNILIIFFTLSQLLSDCPHRHTYHLVISLSLKTQTKHPKIKNANKQHKTNTIPTSHPPNTWCPFSAGPLFLGLGHWE